jgi:NADPH:quinone reductase-like Zn-dependent oxidoreductase
MKAIQLKQYGGAEQLSEADVPKPEAKPGLVVVRILAASYNPIDAKLASGHMRQVFPIEFPFIPGMDFSGSVDALGEGVEGFALGDQVYGYAPSGGSYAEFIATPVDKIAPKPHALSYVEAASLATVGQTALQALELAQLKAGQTILIQGAGGAVGGAATQLAHHRGARVIAVATAESRERLREYGADEVIDYKATPFESVAREVDVVLDGVGGDVQQRSFSVLRPGGALIALTAPPAQEEAAKYHVRAIMLQTEASAASLEALTAKIDAGEIRPFVGRTYPLSAVARAWEDVRTQHLEGKIVFTVS